MQLALTTVMSLVQTRTAQEWQERGYSGTLKSPGVELPPIEAAFEIPEPGDCFCCGSLKDYQVRTLEDMKEWLEISTSRYILSPLEDDEELWQQFNNWSTRILNHKIINKDINKKTFDEKQVPFSTSNE